jgi:cGMP-dependent protein kinase
MGVPICSCIILRKGEDLSEGPSIQIDYNIPNNTNTLLNNTKTNNSGSIYIDKKYSIKNKNNYTISKYKKEPAQKPTVKETNTKKQAYLNKKCTYDPKKILKPMHTKVNLKSSGTLFTSLFNNRISHIIDINSIEKMNTIDENMDKENIPREDQPNENNDNINPNAQLTNIIEKKRKSIINIMSLGNFNQLKVKEESKNDLDKILINDHNNNHNEISNAKENNSLEETKEIKESEIIVNPNVLVKANDNIEKEEKEEKDDEDEEDVNAENKRQSMEISSINELKNNKLMQRPKMNTLPIEVINEPFSKRQIKTLKKIMIQEELIIDDMDENTIEQIIDSVEYIKVKKGTTIYSREDKVENIYYMLDKGKVEYNIDKDKYYLPKHCGIGTNALYNNSINSCSLKTIERSSLYKLSIENYKIIVRNYFEEQHKIKLDFILHNFFFNGLKLSILDKIVDFMVKMNYENESILVEQDKINTNIFLIKEGNINCFRDHEKIKKLYPNEMFGEMGIYSSNISLYEYVTEPNTTIFMISFENLFDAIGNDAPKIIMQKIFEKAVKENEFLNKYFTVGENLTKIFKISQIKYYFNDIVSGIKEKKIFIPVSGSVFKVIPTEFCGKDLPQNLVNQQIKKLYLDNYDSLLSSKIDNNLYVKKKLINKKHILEKGKLNIDLITVWGNSKYYILGDECLIIEINWADIEKNTSIPNQETNLSLNQRINIIKSIKFFKNLTPLQIFLLSNYLHLSQYKYGALILENGPISDKFFLIKSGTVQIKMGDVILETLEAGKTFGDFNIHEKITKKANYVASNTKVECYYIEKENYEEITEKEILCPLKKYLKKSKNKNNITLNKLYYLKDLGRGAYGRVYLVHDNKNFYALKTADIQQLNEVKEIAKIYINEKNIMFSIHHPFIVSIISTFKTKDFLFFLLEFVDGISLRNHINNPKRELRNLNEAKFFLGTMALVLHYLQKQRIIHRDLKPDNIMIGYNGHFKVLDFGIAIDITGKDYARSSIGTFHYMAPEVVKGNNYNNAVDYWSVGIIIYELFYGMVPFGNGENNPLNIYREILNKKLYLPSESEIGLNEIIKDLLQRNDKKRLSSFSQWKNYKLFNDFDFEGLLGLRMKGFYNINKSYNNEDLNNKEHSFIEYMSNHLLNYSSKENDSNIRRKEDEWFQDF